MPPMSGDGGDATPGNPSTWLTVLQSQYEKLSRWANGDFTADFDPAAPPPQQPARVEDLPLQDQPGALARAALEPCVGGAFFPGIEMTYISRDPALYAEPFRLKPQEPGDITQRMACPWQADFYECNTAWWPAQRPDDVMTQEGYEELLAQAQFASQGVDLEALFRHREAWDRGIGEQAGYEGPPRYAGDNDMVNKWSQLAFLVPKDGPHGEKYLVEQERGVVDPYAGMSDRQFFYLLMNIDIHPEFLPKARALAEGYLAAAAALQGELDVEDDYKFFKYTPEAFNARLNAIYLGLVNAVERYDPSKDTRFKTRAHVVERVRQLAPFNQTDGAWLHNISRVGPISEVHSLLFSIWADEAGDGVVEHNHANLYTDLMHQVGIYLPDVSSRAYAEDPNFLDSAFTKAVFQLAISQFTDLFFPEILGMTLQLEWEVVGIKQTMARLDYWNIDSHFYRMHVGIDNAATGHGAKAKRAVEMYLDQVFKIGGEQAMQAQWRRVWNGYVAFATTGNLGADLIALLQRLDDPKFLQQRMVEVVRRKAPYARYNHGVKTLNGIRVNDWFKNPEQFVAALAKSSWIDSDNPEESPFLKLLSFEGPMYKVFTPDEIELVKSWIRSLKATPPGPAPSPTTPAQLMAKLIDGLRDRAIGNAGHQGATLTGPSPADPAQTVTRPVAWWFQQDTATFMRALAMSTWVVRGNAGASPFITSLLGGGAAPAMAMIFKQALPGLGGKTGRQVVEDWINAGCPLPEPTPAAPPQAVSDLRARLESGEQIHIPRLRLDDSPSVIAAHPTGKLRGTGAVH